MREHCWEVWSVTCEGALLGGVVSHIALLFLSGLQNWHNALSKEADSVKPSWKVVLKQKLKETVEYIMD